MSRATSRRTGSKQDSSTASGVSSMIRLTPVTASKVRMLRPSRPMMRPFISSLGRCSTETTDSAVCSVATRWIGQGHDAAGPGLAVLARLALDLPDESRPPRAWPAFSIAATSSVRACAGGQPGDPLELGLPLLLGLGQVGLAPVQLDRARGLRLLPVGQPGQLAVEPGLALEHPGVAPVGLLRPPQHLGALRGGVGLELAPPAQQPLDLRGQVGVLALGPGPGCGRGLLGGGDQRLRLGPGGLGPGGRHRLGLGNDPAGLLGGDVRRGIGRAHQVRPGRRPRQAPLVAVPVAPQVPDQAGERRGHHEQQPERDKQVAREHRTPPFRPPGGTARPGRGRTRRWEQRQQVSGASAGSRCRVVVRPATCRNQGRQLQASTPTPGPPRRERGEPGVRCRRCW